MGLASFIFKKVMPIPKIMNYDKYAFIGAHPDDIEFQCSGTVAKLTSEGKKVTFIIVTDGRFGTQDINMNQEKLVKIRRMEAIEAAKELGVTDIRFLNFHDGGRYNTEEVADKLAIELVDIKPDIIFSIDNHVKSEIHPDHIKVGRAAELALFRCTFPLMMMELGVKDIASPKGIAYYYTDSPNSYIGISSYFNKKISALAKHKSQISKEEGKGLSMKDIISSFKFDGRRYGIRCFSKYAEGFRVLSIDHLHAIPIASKF
ncbi:PIG-L deacetylase family protein [Clostridium paraputrificum]|uniref:PIG-L deacetylase family protein n=1 Tax=Clostridium paraputrificum TaxID=29363 RepID=UPI003565395D